MVGRCLAVALIASLSAGPMLGASGDIHEVAADLVNLRAAPSDAAAVRDRIAAGTQVIELQRDGGWIGIRVLPSGQEGWIYGELLQEVTRSQLDTGQGTAGVGTYSTDLDALLFQVSERFGGPMFAEASESGSTLTLVPHETWLRASSEETQLVAAAAIYGMWKNYRNQSPVEVVILDAAGDEYVIIRDDGESGPRLTVTDQASGSEG
jgi:hypothetical protein